MTDTLSLLSWGQLESMVVDLLEALHFQDIKLVSSLGQQDRGIDIQATFLQQGPTGAVTKQTWLVQVKHVKNRVSADTIATVAGLLQVKSADKALFVTSSNLTSAAKELFASFNHSYNGRLEIWDRDTLISLLDRHPRIKANYFPIISGFPPSLITTTSDTIVHFINQLNSCHPGRNPSDWKNFEDICTSILKEAFAPQLKDPKIQARTWSGMERRDTLFSLRGTKGQWEEIRREFSANFLLFEFKNYTDKITQEEVNQTRNYLKETIGRLGIIISRKGPDQNAQKMRNSIYWQEKKVVLFFNDEQLIELLKLKQIGQDPIELIQDSIDEFYISIE